MDQRTYHPPTPRGEFSLSGLLGVGCAVLLFVLMAVAQMLGKVDVPESGLEESTLAYTPPEIEQIEEEPPPPEEEPPPEELEEEPPQLSLDQLDIALNPGTGSLAGDFGMPSIGGPGDDLGTQDFVDFSSLDQMPRPVGAVGFNFPPRLRKEKVNGKIVLLLQLSPEGKVLDVQIESSTLPRFNDVVTSQVKRWKFTPPTRQGNPVRAQARFPIPIRIN